jgi:replicative DNA helicase
MREPPFSEEAELGVLGCCLLNNNAIDDALTAGTKSDWFYDVRCRDLWLIIAKMRDERVPIDLVTLSDRLKGDSFNRVGSIEFVSKAMDSVPSAANLPYYLEIARDKHRSRKLIEINQDAINTVYSGGGKLDMVLDRCESQLMGIRDEHATDSDYNGKQIAKSALSLLQDRCAGKNDAIPTGWTFMDRILRGGLRAGQIFVVAGRPGSGKTAFALSLISSLCSSGVPTGFISLEMSAEEVGMRMLAIESQVDVGQYDNRTQPTEGEMKKLALATARIAKTKIMVSDKPGQTAQSIAAKARRWVRSDGMRVLVVDYLQLITASEGRERREQIDAISRSMKLLAKELKIPIILLAQLNRAIERDGNRKPRLSDLRESGAIEQDADVVGMLYAAEQQDSDAPQSGARKINMFIAKQRAGAAGVDIPFSFRPELTRFDPISLFDQ